MSTICTHFAPFSFSYLQQQRPLVISTCGFFLNFLVNFSNRYLSSLMIATFMAWMRASSSREDSSELSVTFFLPLALPLSGAPCLVVSMNAASGSDSESSRALTFSPASLALASSSSLRLRFFSLFFLFYSFFLIFFFSFSRSCTSFAARATFALRLARLPTLDSSNYPSSDSDSYFLTSSERSEITSGSPSTNLPPSLSS